ncbi:uncharacterized protein LOC133902446 isoform X2 [Phragmites australis]|uniref:uncharacterized protein LOC133902446 isoform X2 n=1 Tax=Phragmites australis TaxID=29695 RepID=UPI002D769A59|nr:uncharacterized protein LOC133902446 isoform X2 [Phragmites australis]
METDEKRRGKEAAALSGGHLCHVCGYQYPNPHPSAKLRRSHRKHCGKAPAAEEEGAAVGLGVGKREERNAAEGTPLGGEGGGEGEGRCAGEANGGPALRGSAREVDDSVEDKENADEGNGTESLIACTNGGQNKVGHPAEREDSFDEYQDASPFLLQSDSEDGAAPSSVFSIEINNLSIVSSGSSVAANEISLETNGLCKDQFSGEPNMTDLSADSKVGYNLDNGSLRLAGPEISLKLGGPYECAVNVVSNDTGIVDNKSDKTSGNSELIGDLHPSLQENYPVVLDPELQSTCSGKVKSFMEDKMGVLHTMCEASPRPEVGSDNVELETITDSSTSAMPIGNELKVVHTENTPSERSKELPTRNWPVKDSSDFHLPSCQENIICCTTGFQNGFPATNVDDMLNSIAEDSCNDLDFTFEERQQLDIVEQIVNIAEENPSVQKTNGFTEEVCNKQIDPEFPTEALLMDQMSSDKNPFNLDDGKNDDLFELPTDSCYLKLPNAIESRQQVDSTSLTVDQPTVSNQTRMAEAQHCHNSNECILSASSARENDHPVGPDDMPVSSSAELVKNPCLTDVPVDHGLQEDEVHTGGIIFVPSQVSPMELSTVSTQEITAVYIMDSVEIKQADNTTAKDTYAANVEEKKLTEDTAAEMNLVQVQHPDYVEEKKQAGGTMEVSAVQSMGNLEENKQTEVTNAKEMNLRFKADVEEKRQADETSAEKTKAICHTDNVEEKMRAQDTRAKEKMVAAQSTGDAEEMKQPNGIAGQEGNNQNEEIAVTGARLNSGRVHMPLKVLLAEANLENKVTKKPSTKERVLSFRRRVPKEDNSSAKSGSPKSGSDGHHWNSPAKLPRKDIDKRSKARKQPWMPFICCHSVH